MIFSAIDRRPRGIENTGEVQDAEPDTESSALFGR